ncbi:MAG TPA: biopolymer transporter ExbD [Gemmataceae bacterium]|nr:biopolymer transporter ExbD [Gemmataceae bacterium]
MSWKVRHEGSPRSIEGLTLPQVVEGLQEGLWEPTDEVMGPSDSKWSPIESHPQLAEVAADMEPPPPPAHPDETRLDMNPLIDVALVLLIFFILTTTYETIRKVLQMPTATEEQVGGVRILRPGDIVDRMIKVEAKKQGDATVILVEDQPVDLNSLRSVLERFKRNQMALLVEDDVEWGVSVKIQDAARGAGIEQIKLAKLKK